MISLIYVVIGCWLALFLTVIYTCLKGLQLDSYLARNNPEKWADMRCGIYLIWNSKKSFAANLLKGGGGFKDFSEAMKFISNDLDIEDRVVLKLKKSVKHGVRYIEVSFAAFLVAFAVLAAESLF